MPVCGSHNSPPLHHPVRQVGPFVVPLKLQSLLPLNMGQVVRINILQLEGTVARTHMRPAVQLSGAVKVTDVEGAASQLYDHKLTQYTEAELVIAPCREVWYSSTGRKVGEHLQNLREKRQLSGALHLGVPLAFNTILAMSWSPERVHAPYCKRTGIEHRERPRIADRRRRREHSCRRSQFHLGLPALRGFLRSWEWAR